MAIEVFNRTEKKYIIAEEIAEAIKENIAPYMKADAYSQGKSTYPIYNIYYDTPDSYLIRRSIAKPTYKEKLRLRSYGPAGPESKVYIEIKKKVAGLTNKRRTAMALIDAEAFLAGDYSTIDLATNMQVAREVAYMTQRLTLSPKVFIAYERAAYFSLGAHDLRISFDYSIRSRRENLSLSSGEGERLLEDGMCLMEVKCEESIPVWLARLLSEYEAYPVSFSKYGSEYTRYIERKTTDVRDIVWFAGSGREHAHMEAARKPGGIVSSRSAD